MAIPDLLSEMGDLAEEVRERHPGVWRTLQAANTKAKKDPSYAPRYTALLKQSIAKVKAEREDTLGSESLIGAMRDFYRWYEAEIERRGIVEVESRRGALSHQQWMAKWVPSEWMKFARANERVVESGTRRNVDALRPAASALMDAYISNGVRQTG